MANDFDLFFLVCDKRPEAKELILCSVWQVQLRKAQIQKILHSNCLALLRLSWWRWWVHHILTNSLHQGNRSWRTSLRMRHAVLRGERARNRRSESDGKEVLASCYIISKNKMVYKFCIAIDFVSWTQDLLICFVCLDPSQTWLVILLLTVKFTFPVGGFLIPMLSCSIYCLPSLHPPSLCWTIVCWALLVGLPACDITVWSPS